MFHLSQNIFCVLIVYLTYHVFITYCGIIPDNISNTLGNLENSFNPHIPSSCDHHQGPGGGMHHHQGPGGDMHHHHHHHHHGPVGGMHGNYHHHGFGFGTHHYPFHHPEPEHYHNMHHHHHGCPGGCNHHHNVEIDHHQGGFNQNGDPIGNTNCNGDCSINKHSTIQPIDTLPTITPSVVPAQEDSKLDVRFGKNQDSGNEERTLVVAPANCPPGTKYDSRTERCRKSV